MNPVQKLLCEAMQVLPQLTTFLSNILWQFFLHTPIKLLLCLQICEVVNSLWNIKMPSKLLQPYSSILAGRNTRINHYHRFFWDLSTTKKYFHSSATKWWIHYLNLYPKIVIIILLYSLLGTFI